MHQLSIFDMDKTLTRAATFGPFLAYAVPRYQPWRVIFLPLILVTSLGYAARLISRGTLKEVTLALLMGRRIPGDRLAKLARGFAGFTLARNCLAKALAQVERERAEGRQIVLATASYAFYVHEIAHLLGIQNVIATQATALGDTMSPQIVGENCYGAAKLRMIEDWMAQQGLDRRQCHIRFFSDHVSDAPCLSWADQGFATNPHAPLRALAGKRGWTILNWA